MATNSAAATFHNIWHIGRGVQEKAAPFRKGIIAAVQGTGNTARIVVNVSGRPPAVFGIFQLTPL